MTKQAFIPYGRQNINEADIQAVVEVLRSDWLTQGPSIEAFETAIAQYCEVPHAVAFNSATSALHVGCLALGVGPGDVVWTSPITFVASANCALYCGAEVDFVDIDPLTWNMSVDALAAKLEVAAREERLPKVVIPVHLSGQSCEMEGIGALAQRYGFKVMEDASHSIGARWEDKPVGACAYSDITIFSFHPVKIITSGEGGVATTQDPELATRLALLRSHGITRDPERLHRTDVGGWYYEQQELGFNYRMTDIHAALGVSQMARLDTFVAERHARVHRYHEELAGLPLQLPHELPASYSSWHLYIVRIDTSQTDVSRRALYDHMRANQIGVNLHYAPVHLQPYYRARGFQEGQFPQAESYGDTALTIPLYPDLTPTMQMRVVNTIKELL